MLQSIREYTQGWIAGTIISIIILSFALWGIHSYFVGSANSGVVAEVNGVEVTREQLSTAYERLRRQMLIQYGMNAPIKDVSALKERALKALIDMEVLKQASYAEGFRISNAQIDAYWQSMPEFQMNGQFSVDRFNEVLASTMLTTGEFLDLIKTSLMIEQPKLGIVLSSFSLPGETKYTVALVNQERDIEYLVLPLQYFESRTAFISEQQVQSYYDEHKNDFMTKEQVSVDYVEVSIKDLKEKNYQVSEADLKSFYNENLNSYTQPMSWKLTDIKIPLSPAATTNEVAKAQQQADAIFEALNKGEDFTKAGRGHSQSLSLDPKEWITLNQAPEEMQKAIAQLGKKGQFSSPIKTSDGIVIVKALAVKPPHIQTFDAVKDKVKELYVRQRAEEKFAELREKLSEITYEHPDSLKFAADTLGLSIKSTSLFTKDKAGNDFTQNQKVRDIAFSNDVLNLQNNSDVIQINPETVIVLRVKSHVPARLLSLKEVSPKIMNKLKIQNAEAQIAKFAKELKSQLQSGVSPVKVAADNKLKLNWNKTGYIGRYSTKVDPAILDATFRLPNPQAAKAEATYGIAHLSNGYAIIKLKAVKPGAGTDAKKAHVFAEQVQNSEGLLEYEMYKQGHMDQAKITLQQQ